MTESDPQREELRFTLAWAMGDLASSLAEQNRHVDAVRHLEESQKLLGGLSGAEATRLNTTQFLMAKNDLKLGQLRMSQADATQASRDRRETLWREARTLIQRSAEVFGAAKGDAVLAVEALEHLRTAETALSACDQALQGLSKPGRPSVPRVRRHSPAAYR